MKTLITTFVFFIITLSPLNTVWAQDQGQQVYGWQLMTQQERAEHRQKMQSMNTFEEREAYRLEHHNMMQERAREQGITLPDAPMQQGKGMGPGGGQGMGSGMGAGGGMGSGGGRNR
ncbi:MAG: hypothetical protein OQK73_11435 [Gammaproteobacteria bacterium]|nr:hypothetical protein [Gammaproteobacteria bacterium]